MSTAQCLEELTESYEASKLEGGGDKKNWKRVSKRTRHGMNIRVFEFRPTGQQFTYVTYEGEDDDHYELYEGSEWIYSITTSEDDIGAHVGGYTLALNPKSYWEQENALWDQHTSHLLQVLFDIDLDEYEGDEIMENTIMIPADKVASLKTALDKAGLSHDLAFSQFLCGHSGGKEYEAETA